MSWVEGLLGAVMGGAQEYGSILKEEEAAKRKEEEEKRREERALTLAERQEAMREAREKRQEEAKQAAAKKEREAIAQTSPSKAPETGIVGNAIDEYQGEIANTGFTGQTRQATPEEALRWSIRKAREEGREDLAKQREDALYKMRREERESAKEAREQTEFERGPKPEKAPEAIRTMEAKIKATYKGALDESGNPVNSAEYAAHRQAEIQKYVRKEQYIPPERPVGPKPLSEKDRDIAQGRIDKVIDTLGVTPSLDPSKPPQKDLVKQDIIRSLFLKYKSEQTQKDPEKNPDAVYSVDINDVKSELSQRFKQIENRSKEIAAQKFDEYRGGKKDAITDPNALMFAQAKDMKKEGFVNAASKFFLQEAAAGGSEPNTKTVTFQGKQYTVRKAPDGNWYREEGGKYYRWSE